MAGTGTENKIKYNIKNVHVAKQTEAISEETGETTYTYATPKKIPGAVSLSLDAEGDISVFYADGIAYYTVSANNGYSGDLEMALIPSWFREEILNEVKDSKGILFENSENKTNPFALLFEFDGDKKAIRRCLYNCTCTRPSIESETKEDTIEPGTETLSITNSPRADGWVKAQTGPDTDTTAYDAWYTNVIVPTIAEASQAMASIPEEAAGGGEA